MNVDFYKSVGTVGDVHFGKEECRKSLALILKKFRGHLTRKDFLSCNLGTNLDDYILPSLNLTPEVHKLTEKASTAMESLLTGRPIITGYGWCTVEVSRFLQKR